MRIQKGRGNAASAGLCIGRGFLLGSAVAFAVFLLQRSRHYGIAHSLSDGYFVAAVLLIGCGLLRIVASQGAFDLFAFGIRTAFLAFRPANERLGGGEGGRESLPDYAARKRRTRLAERQSLAPCFSLLLPGLLCLFISFLMLLA